MSDRSSGTEELVIILSFIINAMILLFFIIALVGDKMNKLSCLDSQNVPHRWGDRICQEYKDGQWITLDEYKDTQQTWTYNQAALELLEEGE